MSKNKMQMSPVQRFIRAESFSGIILFVATIIAILWCNTPMERFYDSILGYEIGITSDNFKLVKPIILWINDGLMAIFFFLIGLEIKREILIGELNSMKKASLPVFAALGGMVIPVLFYLLLNNRPETRDGWGISMATDIAFTLAILRLLGKRVPLGLKIFLTAFAIIDDIGAVLVIAFFYSEDIQLNLLLMAGGLLLFLYLLSYLKLHSKYLLLIVGVVVWYLFLKAGIHPTLAGVLLAFAVPIRQRISEQQYVEKLCEITDRLTDERNTNPLPVLSGKQIAEIDSLEHLTDHVQSPIQQLEHRLHGWVAFMIMPVFALANAGMNFSGVGVELDTYLSFTIAVSLFAGKAIGVSLFSWLSIRLGLASLPAGINFRQITGIAVLSGLGFTMALFIAGLAFPGSGVFLESAKIGILGGSMAAGILGFILVRRSSKNATGSAE